MVRLPGLIATAGSAAWSRLEGPDGVVEEHRAGTPAHDDPTPLDAGHRFDLASLTKLFLAATALSLADDGLELDRPAAAVLSVGAGPGHEDVTLRHLLTHTSGLPAVCLDWQDARGGLRGPALLDAVLTSRLEAPPGARHTYSCLGYVAAGRLLEEATGRPLDALVTERVLRPLGAATAAFAPLDPVRCVATERQLRDGVDTWVRGEVHDEMAHHLGRPVGNAGLFGTASDVAAFGRMLLARGEGAHARVLSVAAADLMLRPAARAEGYEQAIGTRVRDPAFMAEVDGVGHTGFTGTSLVVAPATGRLAVLLTNRVHEGREGTDAAPARQALARRLLEPA